MMLEGSLLVPRVLPHLIPLGVDKGIRALGVEEKAEVGKMVPSGWVKREA